MAREVYYQNVGNPLQAERLPGRRPELRLPYHPFAPHEDTKLALQIMFFLVLATAAAMVSEMVQLSAAQSDEPSSFVWTNIVLVGVGAYIVIRAIQQRSVKSLVLPIICLLGAALYFNLRVPLGLHLLLTSIFFGMFTWLVGRHWTALCTASPLDIDTAAQLQGRWNGYLLISSLMPPALFLISVVVGSYHFAEIAMLALLVFQLVLSCLLPGRWTIPAVFARTCVSWLTYNHDHSNAPGIFRSPAGPWSTRVIATGCGVIFIAMAYIRWPAEAVMAPAPRTSFFISFLPQLSTGTESTAIDNLAVWFLVLVLFVIGPVLQTLTLPVVLALPVLVEADEYRSAGISPNRWNDLIDEIQNSVDPIERKSLYMGRVVQDGSPLLVPRAVFGEHAHFLGDSGAGKTSLGLSPLIEQLITGEDCSVIVIDLKADSMELLATLMAAAVQRTQQTGRDIPVKHLSNQIGRSTFAFNPLTQPYWQNMELYMRTDILCGALGLTYGADYAEGFYGSSNAAVAYQTFKTFPGTVTFKQLASQVGYVIANADKSELHPETRKAGVHVQTVLNRLGSCEALNVAPGKRYPDHVVENMIDFTEVFTKPQVHYYHLSASLSPGSSPEIARLITYSLLAASTQTERRHQVYLVIDEFQRMVARNIEYMLQLARSMGVGVILANQSMQDLRTSTADLIPPIEANCRYRQWYAVSSGEDRERLIKSSGETVDHHVTRTETSGPNGSSSSVSYAEHIVPRISINDILLASDHPKQSIVRISRGEGYAQYGGMPVIIESDYHIPEDEYQRRRAMRWPTSVPGSFVAGTNGYPSRPPAISTPGPVVTTEVVGSQPDSSTDDEWENPFQSFVQSNESERHGGKRRKKGKKK